MNLLKGCLSLALIFLVTGCASITPFASQLQLPNANTPPLLQSQTEVNLRESNFVVVRSNLQATARGFRLFGLISIVPARTSEAMNRLYLKADMKSGKPQTFAHTMVEHSATYLILFSIPKVTVRADLIEFTPN
jgi:hypothetical protein